MSTPEVSLPEYENEITHSLLLDKKELYFDLPSEIYNFLGLVASEIPQQRIKDIAPDQIACTLIFMRIMQDLRCVQICVTTGYAPAAASIATSIIELAYEIAFLAGNENEATKWFDHKDMKDTSAKHHNRVGYVLKKVIPDFSQRKEEENVEWGNYASVSSVKHGNSMFQQMLGVEFENDHLVFNPLPSVSEQSKLISTMTIYRACQYALRGAAYFADAFIPESLRQIHKNNFEALLERLRLLVDTEMP